MFPNFLLYHSNKFRTAFLKTTSHNNYFWVKSTNQLLQTLPDSLKTAVLEADALGNYENPLYESAINFFYDKYLWGEDPPEEELDSVLSRQKAERPCGEK